MALDLSTMERAVLGALIRNNDQFTGISALISEADFLHPAHRIIFRSIVELAAGGYPFDVIAVTEWLDKHQLLDEAGGLRFVGLLNVAMPTSPDINACVRQIHNAARLRAMKDEANHGDGPNEL
ncbi:MAG: DnaB-like helicase N-terminal domain-containing protein [Thiogranum sp.]